MTSSVIQRVVENAKRESYLRRFARVLEQLDRTLTGRPLSIVLGGTSSLAATRQNTIYLNDGLEVSTISGMVAVLGLNYHELGHVFYTRYLPDTGLHAAYNILEDQRIENIMVRRFGNTKSYYTTAVATFISHDQNNFPLLWGRKYLPKDLRLMHRAASESEFGVEVTDKIARIIDKYIRLVDPLSASTESQALRLIKEFADLIGHLDSPCSHTTSGTSTPAKEEDVAPLQEQIESESESLDADMAEATGSGKSVEAKMEEVAAEAVSEAADSQEVKSMQASAGASSGGGAGEHEVPARVAYTQPVTPEMTLIAKRVADKFMGLVRDNDPGWDGGHSTGRVNMSRVIRGDSYDTVFDTWREGKQDSGDLDIAIAMDISSSMDKHERNYNQVMWILRRAVESLPGNVRVRARYFNTGSEVSKLKRVSYEMYEHVRAVGGTIATEVTQNSLDEFLTSNITNRVFIIVTDGEWHTAHIAERNIVTMNEIGVKTALFNIGGLGYSSHHCQVAAVVETPSDIITPVAQIVESLITEQA